MWQLTLARIARATVFLFFLSTQLLKTGSGHHQSVLTRSAAGFSCDFPNSPIVNNVLKGKLTYLTWTSWLAQPVKLSLPVLARGAPSWVRIWVNIHVLNKELRTSVQVKLKSNETLSSDVLWVCPKKIERIWINQKERYYSFF